MKFLTNLIGASAALLFSTCAMAQQNIDVLGIRTGMKPDEVRSLLKKQYPTTKIEENAYQAAPGTSARPALAIMVVEHGVKGQSGFEDQVRIRFTATTGKAFWISRNLNKEAPLTAYEQGISGKYGSPMFPNVLKGRSHWNWDAKGKPMIDTGGFCVADFDRAVPPRVERTCGLALTTQIGRSPKPETADRLRIAIMDSAVLTEEIAAVEKARLADPRGAAQKPTL